MNAVGYHKRWKKKRMLLMAWLSFQLVRNIFTTIMVRSCLKLKTYYFEFFDLHSRIMAITNLFHFYLAQVLIINTSKKSWSLAMAIRDYEKIRTFFIAIIISW